MNLFKHNLFIAESQNYIDITTIIKDDIKKTTIKNGIVLVYCPHTTAGITINENADPDVIHDLIYGFNKAFPINDNNYKHFEGNSHAHLKSSTINPSQSLILNEGNIILGTWQSVYFVEFDGPRNRNFYVKILEG
ncbi:MAG: YjbQ family protein [Clostridiales bacterium]|nr:YjbQ family protein [Clostridiales bacterium]